MPVDQTHRRLDNRHHGEERPEHRRRQLRARGESADENGDHSRYRAPRRDGEEEEEEKKHERENRRGNPIDPICQLRQRLEAFATRLLSFAYYISFTFWSAPIFFIFSSRISRKVISTTQLAFAYAMIAIFGQHSLPRRHPRGRQLHLLPA